jgi:hypothetical protein
VSSLSPSPLLPGCVPAELGGGNAIASGRERSMDRACLRGWPRFTGC